jgi:ketosteroid isomerase-like protein
MTDLDGLKAIFGRVVGAFNARDPDTLSRLAHDKVTFFGALTPFPVDGKDPLRQLFQTMFAYYEIITFSPINPQFYVVGPTGVVWGNMSLMVKPQGSPPSTLFARYTWTFVQSEGEWLILAAHISRLPSGN